MNPRFQAAHFLTSANALTQLPESIVREVAFAGRSNAGKSSALNVLTHQNSLARTSKTPGRTQLINYFEMSNGLLVDLPGYGYAKVPEAMRKHWRMILQEYFAKREQLCGLILLMDVRHPLTDLDLQMLQWCDARALPVHILLTKADKLKRGPGMSALHLVQAALKKYAMPSSVQLFSAPERMGVEIAQTVIEKWLDKL